MRAFVYFVATLMVIGTAYWAYRENYATQAAMANLRAIQAKIGHEREALGVLRAEWAYLNRPERLRELSDLNFGSLQLMPLLPAHFGDVEQVGYPRAAPMVFDGAIDLSADLPTEEAE